MGLFDYVKCDDQRFVCSVGHDLRGEEFQTKDLGCTMGESSIANGRVEFSSGGWGDAPDLPITDTLHVYCNCTKCPAFVQDKTFNLVPTWVEFRVEVVAGEVRDITRVSPSTAEFLATEPHKPYMAGCRGPMPYADARQRHLDGKFFPWDPVPPAPGGDR